ncbi:hypothetical protein HY406_01025 [Candidatus Giovannonibacteria bacterium]|nr:hypothetical protein [Candidatus Giovannonibacteria bacterium]
MKKDANVILGFDLDGVIVDHFPNKAIVVKRLGLSIKTKDLASDILNKKLSVDARRAAGDFLYDNMRSALEPQLFGGVLDILKFVEAKGGRYFLISKRGDPSKGIRLLQKRGLWPKFFNSRNAFFVDTISDKNKKAAELGVSHYIDDQPSVLKELKAVKHKFLFDPYGSFGHPRRYKKISSWKEFPKELDGIIE